MVFIHLCATFDNVDYEQSFFWEKHKFYLILIFIGFLVYFNSLFGGFVWDDVAQIVSSPLTNSLSSISTIFTIGQANVFYRPFFLSYLTVVNVLFQENVFFFHILQVGMHIANAMLVFWVLKRFFKEIIAFVISLIFLTHPINAEVVVYMSAVSDVLVFLFGIIALSILMKARMDIYHFIIAGFLILLALLTKESGILWLFITLAYLFLFKKIKQWGTLFFIGISIGIYAFMRVFVAHITTTLSNVNNAPIAQLPFLERLISMPKIIFFYIYTFIFPVQLSISQHWVVKSLTIPDFFLLLFFDALFIGLLLAGGLYIYKSHRKELRVYSFFLIWFILSLALYVQIIPLDMTVAERWFYIPMMGMLGMTGIVLQTVKAKPSIRFIGLFTIIIVIACLSLRTIVRNTNWINAITLYSHDAQFNKDSFDLENQLAGELSLAGRYDEALIHAQRAVKLEPHDARNWVTIGTIYMRQKEVKKGLVYLRKALDYDGGNYNAFYNLAYGYLLLNKPQEAKGFAEWGMKTYSKDANLLLFKAIAEYKLGDEQRALKDAEAANNMLRTESSNYIYTQIVNRQPIRLE